MLQKILLQALLLNVELLTDCTKKILHKIDSDNTIVIFDSTLSAKDVRAQLEESRVNINMDLNLKLLRNLDVEQDAYYIHDLELNKIKIFFEAMQENRYYNTRSWLLISYSIEIILQDVFNLLYKYHLINAIVLHNMSIYTYSPISNKSCNNTKPILLGTCYSNKTINLNKWIAAKYTGCTYSAVAVPFPPFVVHPFQPNRRGFMITIVETIAERLDFNITYINHSYLDWGYKQSKGSFVSAMAPLAEATVDLLICSLVNSTINRYFEYSLIDAPVVVYYYVPSGEPVENWRKLFLVFQPYSWLLIASMILLTSLTLYMFKQNETTQYRSFVYCALNFWRIIFSGLHQEPTTLPLKSIFLSASVTFLLLTSVFQGNLLVYLFKLVYYKPVGSIEELLASGLQWGGQRTSKDHFKVQNRTLDTKIYNGFNLCDFSTACINRTANDRDFAVSRTMRYVNYIIHTLLQPNGMPKIDRFDYGFRAFPILYSRKGMVVMKDVRRIILRMFENGIYQKLDLYENTPNFYVPRHEFTKLTIDYLLGPFMILGIGVVLGVVSFVVEVVVHRMGDKKNIVHKMCDRKNIVNNTYW